MNRNLSTTDRIVRGIIGAGLVGYGLARGRWIGALGLYPLITGITGSCPVYKAVGISTLKSEIEEEAMDLVDEVVEAAVP